MPKHKCIRNDVVNKRQGLKELKVQKRDLLHISLGNDTFPYVSSVPVVPLTPKDFGLERWQASVTIPDYMMRKIYRHGDGDDEVQVVHILTDRQRKILIDHVIQQRRLLDADELTFNPEPRMNTRKHPPLDTLMGDLENIVESSETLINNENSTSSDSGIYVCARHKIQAECDIARQAFDKMDHLSPEEEYRYQELKNDKDYMQFLDKCIEQYIEANDS